MRRLDAILASALITYFVEVLAAFHYPNLAVASWVVLDLALSVVRLPTVVYIWVSTQPRYPDPVIRPWMVDLLVCIGIVWSALVGVGCALCLMTNDPGLSILAVLVAMGTIGGQGVRSPGSPRMNIAQMCAVIVPLVCGLVACQIPMTGWALVLAPLYLFGMISITRQLHFDYERMIVARLENRRLAFHCPLTGLPNRAFFSESLANALKAPTDHLGDVITVMYLDLDGFKAVNDTFGHSVGDELLMQVADRLRDMPSRDAVIARLGGDEFAIALRSHEPRQVEAVATHVIEAVTRPYLVSAGITVRVGVSIGIARGNATSCSTTTMKRADDAIYAVKREGRGTFRWYADSLAALSVPLAEPPLKTAQPKFGQAVAAKA